MHNSELEGANGPVVEDMSALALVAVYHIE